MCDQQALSTCQRLLPSVQQAHKLLSVPTRQALMQVYPDADSSVMMRKAPGGASLGMQTHPGWAWVQNTHATRTIDPLLQLR
jgi:hypothetical protein